MKKLFIFGVFAFYLLPACSRISSLTYINPNKTFVLGEGTHNAYSADIKNVGLNAVEVRTIDLGGNEKNLGDLKPGQKNSYEVLENTTVTFKNKGKLVSTALAIKLNTSFNTRLSMGYKVNKD